MSDNFDYENQGDDDNTPQEPRTESPNIKLLREKAERSEENERKANESARELAFLKAGVDTDSPVGKLLFAGYNGELEKEAIVQAATDVGALSAASSQGAAPVIPAEELGQTNERLGLAGDSVSPGYESSIDPQVEGLQAFQAEVASGKPRDKAAAAYFNRVMPAANAGDQRVIVQEGHH